MDSGGQLNLVDTRQWWTIKNCEQWKIVDNGQYYTMNNDRQ